MYIKSKNSFLNQNKTISFDPNANNNIFLDYDYKYIFNVKMEKIKREIKDYVIDRYTKIIMSQNKEIILLKNNIEDILQKSNNIFKTLTINSKDDNFTESFCIYSPKSGKEDINTFSKTFLNCKNKFNILIKDKNKENNLNKENIQNNINININYLQELNKKDLLKINSIHRKILSTKSFHEIINDSNKQESNNFLDYVNTINLTDCNLENSIFRNNNIRFSTSTFNSKKNKLLVKKNTGNKLKIKTSKNNKIFPQKTGIINQKSSRLNFRKIKKNISKENMAIKNSNNYIQFYDDFKKISSSVSTTQKDFFKKRGTTSRFNIIPNDQQQLNMYKTILN